MTTLVVAGPAGISEHDGGPYHPEQQSRLFAVMDGVRALELEDEVVYPAVREASLDELSRVHSSAYLAELEAFCARGGGDIDPDTYARPDSWTAARRAAGAGLVALAELERRGDGIAFVPVRPPGHHATADRAMGFCLVNNVAVAAASRTAVGERVLIVDWDVHHGNGTQAIFWDDPDVLYVSTHQHPLFPGTGRPDEVGGPGAPGLTLNMPLPPGATGDVVRAAIDEVARGTIEDFRPDWVLVSCGFDAHQADPLGELELSGGDFAELAPRGAGVRAGPRAAGPLPGGRLQPAVARVLGRGDAGRAAGGAGPPAHDHVRWARAGAAPRRRHGAAPRHRPCAHGGRPVTAPVTIAVGYDGSPDAGSAVAWAARVAVALGARLHVVHAVGLLEHAGLAGHVGVDGDVAVRIAVEAGIDPGDVEWSVVDGDPCSALLRMAESPEPAAMLVVGSRGAGAHAGTLIGSTSLELAEHARVPVTIVPSSYRSD